MGANWWEFWDAAPIRACLPCPAWRRPSAACFDGMDRLHSAGLQAQHNARGLCPCYCYLWHESEKRSTVCSLVGGSVLTAGELRFRMEAVEDGTSRKTVGEHLQRPRSELRHMRKVPSCVLLQMSPIADLGVLRKYEGPDWVQSINRCLSLTSCFSIRWSVGWGRNTKRRELRARSVSLVVGAHVEVRRRWVG